MNTLYSALRTILQQGEDLLGALSDRDYADANSQAMGASIGAHYRHHLDHVDAWLQVGDDRVIDYDARTRDRATEVDRFVALQRTRAAMEAIQAWTDDELDTDVQVRCRVVCDGTESPCVRSTMAREAINVILHGVHHFALMAMICNLRGVTVPEGLGLAPSTAQHRHELATNGATAG
jgi:hypothetical protein